MDPLMRRPKKDRDYGGLFAQEPVASEGRKRARKDVTAAQLESDRVRICSAIDAARDRGLTRKEIEDATNIGKDTVNRRLGHDILHKPPQQPTYIEPFMRGTEKVIVNRWHAPPGWTDEEPAGAA